MLPRFPHGAPAQEPCYGWESHRVAPCIRARATRLEEKDLLALRRDHRRESIPGDVAQLLAHLAAEAGIEPALSGPNPEVLPLDHSAIRAVCGPVWDHPTADLTSAKVCTPWKPQTIRAGTCSRNKPVSWARRVDAALAAHPTLFSATETACAHNG